MHQVWLIERFVEASVARGLADLAASSAAAARMLAQGGEPVSYLGSVLLVAEDTCFCAFTAQTRELVENVADLVPASRLRIVEARWVGASAPSPTSSIGRASVRPQHGRLLS